MLLGNWEANVLSTSSFLFIAIFFIWRLLLGGEIDIEVSREISESELKRLI